MAWCWWEMELRARTELKKASNKEAGLFLPVAVNHWINSATLETLHLKFSEMFSLNMRNTIHFNYH